MSYNVLKQCITALLLVAIVACKSQKNNTENYSLSISPLINQKDSTNIRIINALSDFLESKDKSLTQNIHWLPSDFEKYGYPYYDLYMIEASKFGSTFYKPTLMEIIPTKASNKKIIKLAFIGHRLEQNENQIKSIYNIIANIENENILFSKYLDLACQDWQIINSGSLTYKISPLRKAVQSQIENQLKDINKICGFFNTDPIPITYYSCTSVKEVFEIRGFDYHTLMYVDTTGGLADFGNIIYSGNNAETYTHEITHVYTKKLFPSINNFIDEGIATYVGGSGGFDYEWHREKLKTFLAKNPHYKIEEHTDPYERIFFENETSIPYLTAALICEMCLHKFGKEKLIFMLQSQKDLWSTLNEVGLTKQNIGLELRNVIHQPVILPF